MERLIYHGRYVAYSDGRIANVSTGRVLSPGVMSRAYLSVVLFDGSKPKRPKSFLVHRLIAEAFFGERPGMQVNHKNGDKKDNRLENLEWVTGKENAAHAREVLGKTGCGVLNSRCKIPPELIGEIKKGDRSARSWAEELNCSAAHIRQIRQGKYRSAG